VGSSYSTEKRIQRLPVLLYLDALENAMHYYKRNLGDYAKKAGRLSMLQHGSYTLLIDACYDREQFPTRDEAIDWTWASSTAEIEAVDFVLAKFFTLEDGRYVQKRIQEEVAAYHAMSETNKRIAMYREVKRNESSTKRERSVNEAPPNHKPLTINQEPLLDAAGAASTKPAKKGTRLVDNWQLPKAWGEWAMAEYPAWTAGIVRLEAEKFADHWHAKAGKDAAKLDWEATWRTWCRSDICQRSHAGKPSFAQQAADVARTTVPSRPDRDPVLLEIERHSAKAAPIPESIREKLQALKGGVLQ
jgi:uncharacterized protein YdaU (DUF1376 family)